MDRFPNQAGTFWTARHICAWLLIALMLPGGVTNSLLIWCSSSDGHSAIEFTLGSDFHRSKAATPAKSSSGPSIVSAYAHRCHDTDCVDIPAISSAVFASVSQVGKSDELGKATSHQGANTLLAALSQHSSVQDISNDSWRKKRQTRDLVDPTVLLLRSKVLRI